MVAASFRVTVCGHVIRINIAAQTQQAIQEAAIQRASLSLTSVDKDRMMEYAREAGLDNKAPGWFFARKRQEIMQNLHVSLYALILGILDDLLANTKIELLSDRVYFDIVPSRTKEGDSFAVSEQVIEPAEIETRIVVTEKRKSSRPVIPFMAGIGVGFAIVKHIEDIRGIFGGR